jgi:hypothetical protein
MNFHGLMVVRDEEDILQQTLTHLLSWLDGLYVLDLGSTDSTWQILQDFAARDRRVVLHETKPIIFHEGLRAVLFDAYRHRFKPGDWVTRVDADEFYHVAPPSFVETCLRKGDTCVYLQWYFFRLTNREVAAYESGQIDTAADRLRPIEERRRYYKVPDYAEPRMFRYRTSMQWPADLSFPFNAGYVAAQCIPIRHYPHRDPWQMSRRYSLRATMTDLRSVAGPHWRLANWRKDILDVDERTGEGVERNGAVGLGAAKGHTAGGLHYWGPGDVLPRIHHRGHVAQRGKRLLQRLIHPVGLPLLDRFRPQFCKEFAPPVIPAAAAEQLRHR